METNINCPDCGSIETECSTWEAWCYDCDWYMTSADPRFQVFRTATLNHRDQLAKVLDRLLQEEIV